jgi:hypothetical protein
MVPSSHRFAYIYPPSTCVCLSIPPFAFVCLPPPSPLIRAGSENYDLLAQLIKYAKSNSFLASLGRHYRLDTWVHAFDYSRDNPESDIWGKVWADAVEAWIGACERERVLWWEREAGGEMVRWLDWVFCVRYVPGGIDGG